MHKNKDLEAVKMKCLEALERLRKGIENHEKGISEDLNIPMLLAVKAEIEKMLTILDSSQYNPGYPRFLLDWPSKYGLNDYLFEIASYYRKHT